MKKFTALFLTLISLLGLIWVAIVFVKMQTNTVSFPEVKNTGPKMEKEGQIAFAHIQSLSQMLVRIEDEEIVNVERKLGPLPEMGNSDKSNPFIKGSSFQGGARVSSAPKLPSISMIYISSNMKRAVVDGTSYLVGEQLPDGSTIKDIEIDQLVLDIKGRTKILKAPKPQVLGTTVKTQGEVRE